MIVITRLLSLESILAIQGQMKKFRHDLAVGEYENTQFTSVEIDFVVAQVWDIGMKLKHNQFQCPTEYNPDPDYSEIFAD